MNERVMIVDRRCYLVERRRMMRKVDHEHEHEHDHEHEHEHELSD